jgi:hypothetical protein
LSAKTADPALAVCLNTAVLVSGKALAAVFSGISAMYTGG